MIYQQGQLNASALNAPGVYLQIQPPPPIINGLATNLLGLVGVGSWGPPNSPTLIGSPNDLARWLGSPQVRKYDLATAVSVALSMSQNSILFVRVTDGTDAAATVQMMDTAGTPAVGLTLTGMYTGTLGNNITGAITTGTKPSSYKLTVTMPGFTPEVYDNITGSGNALWVALANAVNNGLSGVRGPSQLVVATASASTALPNTSTTYTLAGGTDGTTGVVDSTLVGVDTLPRKGMYALRSSGAQVGTLVDHTDSTAWSAILTFALAEGIYMGVQGPAGASYSTVSSSLNTAGADGYGIKVFVGDWVYWQDNTNNVRRLLGPTTFWAPFQANMAPHLSSLNAPMFGLASTQRVLQQSPYSLSEIGQVAQARLDAITNPSPGGNYFACQTGRNASSNAATNGDNYTRMTNYLALTLTAAFGYAIGKPQTTTLRNQVKAAMQNFLSNMWRLGMIGDVNAPSALPFAIEIDAANNPNQAVATGYMTANVTVKYLSIVFYFVINLQGGQTVTIQSSSSAAH